MQKNDIITFLSKFCRNFLNLNTQGRLPKDSLTIALIFNQKETIVVSDIICKN